MFAHKIHEKADFETYLGWFLLSFLGGNINAGGFVTAHKFVSHVTGFATLTGISLQAGHFLEALGFITIPLYFLAGVMFSGYLSERRDADGNRSQKFAPIMALVALIMGVVALLGTVGIFGSGEAAEHLGHDYVLLALLCGACGLQNAAISSASGATVRTTHLTGLTTDLGLGLIRAEIHPQNKEQQLQDRRSNTLRIFTIISFTLGSAVGAFLYVRFHYLAFLLPMLIALYAAFAAQRAKA